ncbi:DUF4177 domain-containing protein [Bdellovibrionota bacterium FG-2]
MAKYKMVQIPPNVTIAATGMLGKAPDQSTVAAAYLEATVNEMARQGWEFFRVDPIGVTSTPGCLAGLFGHKEVSTTYYVITFKQV